MNYNKEIITGENGDKTTMKVVACSYQSMFPNGRLKSNFNPGSPASVRMAMSPVLTITYGARVVENACKVTDTTKCKDNACLQGGLINLAQDTSQQITATDCTSFTAIRDSDNPTAYDVDCKSDNDCPSQRCRLKDWVRRPHHWRWSILLHSCSRRKCSRG